jgi:CDK-activating kinase assembly factor MAT1
MPLISVPVHIKQIHVVSMSKTEQDFPSIEAYNDYLELFEDYVFQLLHDENVQQVYSELEQYRSENKHVVEKAIRQKVEQEKKLQELLESEQRKRKAIYEEDVAEAERQAMQRAHDNEQLLQELTASDQPASMLVCKKLKVSSASTANISQPSMRPPSSQMLRPSAGKAQPGKRTTTGFLFDEAVHDKNEISSSSLFDPLAHLPPLFILPSYLHSTHPWHDPQLQTWLEDPQVKAGGCSADAFHLRALEFLYKHSLSVHK